MAGTIMLLFSNLTSSVIQPVFGTLRLGNLPLVPAAGHFWRRPGNCPFRVASNYEQIVLLGNFEWLGGRRLSSRRVAHGQFFAG